MRKKIVFFLPHAVGKEENKRNKNKNTKPGEGGEKKRIFHPGNGNKTLKSLNYRSVNSK